MSIEGFYLNSSAESAYHEGSDGSGRRTLKAGPRILQLQQMLHNSNQILSLSLKNYQAVFLSTEAQYFV
jgi:hypothetical protein